MVSRRVLFILSYYNFFSDVSGYNLIEDVPIEDPDRLSPLGCRERLRMSVEGFTTEADEYSHTLRPLVGKDEKFFTHDNTTLLWPDGVVYYFVSGVFSPCQRSMIHHTFRFIEMNTCVRFTQSLTRPEKHYLAIVGNIGGTRSFSMGYDTNFSIVLDSKDPKAVIKLRWQILAYEGPKCGKRVGYFQHALLHALGMWNTQQRHDRNYFVTINESNIIEEALLGIHRNKNEYSLNLAYKTWEVPYEWMSVMHGKREGQDVSKWYKRNESIDIMSVPKHPGACLGQRIWMTDCDVQMLRRMYNCKNYPDPPCLTLPLHYEDEDGSCEYLY